MRSRRGATEIFVVMLAAFGVTMLVGLMLSTLEGPGKPAHSRKEACPIVAAGSTPSGATFLIRECFDGTLVREYPFPEEETE